MYKSFSLLLTPSPDHYTHTSPNVTMDASGTRITVFCDPQKSALIYSGQCVFPKRASDAAIGRSPCDKSIPSDTQWPFIKRRLILFRDHLQGEITLCQEVHGSSGGGSSWRPLWKRAWPSSTRDPKFDRPNICPRGPYWSWCFQLLQLGRRNWPYQESGAIGWWWHVTSPW